MTDEISERQVYIEALLRAAQARWPGASLGYAWLPQTQEGLIYLHRSGMSDAIAVFTEFELQKSPYLSCQVDQVRVFVQQAIDKWERHPQFLEPGPTFPVLTPNPQPSTLPKLSANLE